MYYWRVRIRDAAGRFSAWAESTWETALFDEADWEGAAWIGGRQPQDHNWTDFEATVDFTGGRDAQGGLRFLFHAEPIGKTWAEAYEWVLGLAPRLDSRLSAPAALGANPADH